jgi:hypothetical protein
VATIEGREIRAILFGGRSDEGVCEAGAVAPSIVSPVESSKTGRLLRDRKDGKRQE